MQPLGVASVAAITAICFLVGMVCKAVPRVKDKIIPIICGVTGAAVGLLWFCSGWTGYPAHDPVTAVAVGITSGLAATGVNQAYRQIMKPE